MTALRAVAIDLALRKTGLSWTHNHRGEPGVGTDTVICETTTTGHPRIEKILTSVDAAVGCEPHIVAIEAMYAGAGKGGTPLRLAEVHGVITHRLWSCGIPYVYVEPQQIKIYATGNGNADKPDVQAAVTAEWGHLAHVDDEHQADSMALLALTLDAYGAPLTTVLNPQRLRAVKAVRWPALGELS